MDQDSQENVQHNDEHDPVFWCVFTPEGTVRHHDTVCRCELAQYDVSDFPKGAYMTVYDLPRMVH